MAQYFPSVQPTDDFALMVLGMYRYTGDASHKAVTEWVEAKRKEMLKHFGSNHDLQKRVNMVLSCSTDSAIGVRKLYPSPWISHRAFVF